MTRTGSTLLAALVVLIGASALVGAYRGRRAEAPPQPEYAPAATIKDLMDAIVDPSADDIWNAVTTTATGSATVEKAPRTDQEWDSVRNGAIRLVESANLLLIPGRRMAGADERSETPGVELEPTEMDALVAQDRPGWNAKARALRDVSLEALQAVDAKDAKRLFDVGDRIDAACESCHRQYWYPNERIPAFPSNFGTATTAVAPAEGH